MAKTGRKNAYEEIIAPHLDEICEAVKAGATIKEIAKSLGVAESTINKYKKEKTELADIFARGRAHIVIQIRGALLKKALGYDYQEIREHEKKNENGESVLYRETFKKHQPASETAAAMLLRNYDEGWIDKDNTTTQIKKQELELRKAVAKDNAFDEIEV